MPHLASELNLSLRSEVQPIVGNPSSGGAVYDGKGEALWIANVGGSVQVHRTRAGWRSLLTSDGSVDLLSTVHSAGYLTYPFTGALQRIGGTIYAQVVGKRTGDNKAGQWIFRDTSAGADGSGPWVLHGTVNALTWSVDANHFSGGESGGEILVLPSGRWVTNATIWGGGGGSYTVSYYGAYTSDDGGVTWTQRCTTGDIYANRFSRNFAKWGSNWIIGGAGGFKSADATTWTGAALGGFLLSTPTTLYTNLNPEADPTGLYSGTTDPEAAPTWTRVGSIVSGFSSGGGDDVPYPLLCNVGPDSSPAWAAARSGRITRVSRATTQAPPCRQYPREDGLGMSSAARVYPRPRSEQSGVRHLNGTYW